MDNIYTDTKSTRKGIQTILKELQSIPGLCIKKTRLWCDTWVQVELGSETFKKLMNDGLKPQEAYIEGFFDGIESHIRVLAVPGKALCTVNVSGTRKSIYAVFGRL